MPTTCAPPRDRCHAPHADQLTVVTWNTARQQEVPAIGTFAREADVLVLQEITTTRVARRLAAAAGLSAWKSAVSDFVTDDHANESSRLEVAILSPHAIGLGGSYDDDSLPSRPIDAIYAQGPLFDDASRLVAERGPLFGSDHFAIRVSVE